MWRLLRVGVMEERLLKGLAEAAFRYGDVRVCFNVSVVLLGCWRSVKGEAELEREQFLKAAKTTQHTM